eukprot:8851-Pelagococcus_subviridis.AAC.1
MKEEEAGRSRRRYDTICGSPRRFRYEKGSSRLGETSSADADDTHVATRDEILRPRRHHSRRARRLPRRLLRPALFPVRRRPGHDRRRAFLLRRRRRRGDAHDAVVFALFAAVPLAASVLARRRRRSRSRFRAPLVLRGRPVDVKRRAAASVAPAAVHVAVVLRARAAALPSFRGVRPEPARARAAAAGVPRRGPSAAGPGVVVAAARLPLGF